MQTLLSDNDSDMHSKGLAIEQTWAHIGTIHSTKHILKTADADSQSMCQSKRDADSQCKRITLLRTHYYTSSIVPTHGVMYTSSVPSELTSINDGIFSWPSSHDKFDRFSNDAVNAWTD